MRYIEVHFKAQEKNHPIFIESGILFSSLFAEYCLSLKRSLVILSDANVAALYGKGLKDFLHKRGIEAPLVAFPAGEEFKNREIKQWIEDQLFAHRLGRDSALIALGGGVTTDLAGFIAATYCRGIPLIGVPTSLLAMVDASIGGKNGVNVPAGKNMIGTIYQPQALFIDPNLLATLPLIEIKNGLAEVIKHGLIASPASTAFLEKESEAVLNLNFSILAQIIKESCCIKRGIVEEDEQEKGKRALLNFGHTIGHALEKVTHYRIPHGQAIAIGMMGESYLSMKLGYLPTNVFHRIVNLLNTYQLNLTFSEKLSSQDLLQTMTMDKKATKQMARFVLLEDIGKPISFDGAFCSCVDEQTLFHTLEWLTHAMHSC
jgi:3-dehydroquinate synthase